VKAGPADVIICFAIGVVCFALGMFSANHRVTFDGPKAEAPAPSPFVFEGEGWTIKTIKTGPVVPNIYVLTAPDGVRWIAYGNTSPVLWPTKTP